MATTIGSLAVMLSANPEDFVRGLIIAGKKAEKFSEDTKKQLGPGLLSGLKQGFGKALGVAGVLGLGFGISELVGFVKAQADAIDTTGKLAAELGISTEALVGLQHAADLANVSQEELTGGLRKFSRIIGEAASGSKEMRDALALWGFSAQQLAAVPLNQALGQVADVIAAIPNPAQQAAAAVDFFGKGAQRLLPFLKDGSAGLRKMDADARALFLTFSAAQFDDVQRMNDAITRVGSAFTGIARGAVIEFAPVIENLADSFTAMVQDAGGLKPIFADLSKSSGEFVIGLLDGIQTIRMAIKEWGNDLGKISTVFKYLNDVSQHFGGGALKGGLGWMFGGGAAKFGADDPINQAIAKLKDLQTATQAALGGGAKGGRLLPGMPDTKDVDAFNKKLADMAQQLQTQTLTPLEVFNAEMARLNDLFRFGAIDAELWGRGVGKAVAELEKLDQVSDVKLPGALVQGSREAASAIIRAESQGQRAQNPQKELKDVLDRAAKEEAKHTDLLRQLLEELRQLNLPVQVNI